MALDRDRRANAPCHICGQPIDYISEPSTVPYSYEPDHLVPVSRAPELELDLLNIAPCHMKCNRSRGAGDMDIIDIGQRSRIW